MPLLAGIVHRHKLYWIELFLLNRTGYSVSGPDTGDMFMGYIFFLSNVIYKMARLNAYTVYL